MTYYFQQMAPGADVVAKVMFSHAHHAFAEQPIILVPPIRCQIINFCANGSAVRYRPSRRGNNTGYGERAAGRFSAIFNTL
jgi:hypothetical protein